MIDILAISPICFQIHLLLVQHEASELTAQLEILKQMRSPAYGYSSPIAQKEDKRNTDKRHNSTIMDYFHRFTKDLEIFRIQNIKNYCIFMSPHKWINQHQQTKKTKHDTDS